MSETLRRGLLPIWALAALWLAGAATRADDAVPAQPAREFDALLAGETREATTGPRIYVPLHPAEPREIEEEFAPRRTPAFGAPPDRPAAGSGKPAAGSAVIAPPLVAGPGPGRQSAAAPDGR